jgi:hypothetical protein
VTAIERRDGRASVRLGGPLPDMAAAMEFAKVMATSELIPRALRGKPANVLAIILYGQDIGLSQMQAMQNVNVVEGKPSMSAELWRAKLREHGYRYYIPCATCGGPPEAHPEVAPRLPTHEQHAYVADQSDRHCKLRIIRGDTGQRGDYEWTIQDGVNAGRVALRDGRPYARSKEGKPLPWETHTTDMLFARVTTRACRAMCPEIALGWTIPDEAEEIAAREQVEASRVDSPQATGPAAAEPVAVAAEVEAIEAEVIDDQTAAAVPDYACTRCGLVGHYEDDCPEVFEQ